MARLCSLVCVRRAARPRALLLRQLTQIVLGIVALVTALCLAPAVTVFAKPKLWLPTPPGQTWKIIQGYNCGTHTGAEDHYALDLVNTEGKTMGAPVRAAASGKVMVWVASSGTLILDHGGNLFTQYTHLQSAASTKVGASFKRGQVIGRAGDREANGTPHLHFAAFEGSSRRGRHSIPLSFADGPKLPDVGGCSQHQGEKLTADAGKADDGDDTASADDAAAASNANAPKELTFNTDAEINHWYNNDIDIAFGGTAAAHGFSVAWDADPGGDVPERQALSTGKVQLDEAGEGLHTLYVRAWDSDGKQTLATFGPVGFDKTGPRATKTLTTQTIATGQPAKVHWEPATDKGAGVAGYHVYLGTDKDGTSEWYSETPEVQTTSLPAGTFVLRVQPIDYANNAGKWATVGEITVE